MEQWLIIILLGINSIILLFILFKKSSASLSVELKDMKEDVIESNEKSLRTFNELVGSNIKQTNDVLDKRLVELTSLLKGNQEQLQQVVSLSLNQIQTILNNSTLQNEQKLNHIRETIEKRLSALQEDNSKKLDEMRMTVDEKLQKTLEDRISQSFKQVSEQLESVYKSLGEMKNIGVEVGDLKKVLSNVKTKGILGEIQLGAILEQILSPEQYEMDISTIPGSGARVEYAVKLPGSDAGPIYLPIDSKFPTEAYMRLNEAYELGDKDLVEKVAKELETTIKTFAKDIHDKYIQVPYTTDFGILFLPIEGLYAEVVRRGLVETLQRLYKINIAGPTTMAALLNSLQMGFKTLAIQKRSGEVWQVLSAVKSEFETFGTVLQSAQDKLTKTSDDLDKLIGVRTRKIQSKLKDVSILDIKSAEVLEILEDKED
jgi:DNA recombination protein RmuC